MEQIFDVAVIGGGPAGMTAAIVASKRCRAVALVEAQSRVGRKLLSTGNGRCNISNAVMSAEKFRSRDTACVERVLNSVSTREVMLHLDHLGLDCFEEREGRIYPRSEQASSVVDILRAELEHRRVSLITDCRITSVRKKDDVFTLAHGEGTIKARRVVVACGSPAAPQLGGCADGKTIFEKLGHTLVPFAPALTGVQVESPHLKALKGVRWRCEVSLLARSRVLRREAGEVQFNDGNLSGIVIMQMSSHIAAREENFLLRLDLLPEYSVEELEKRIGSLCIRLGHMPVESFLAGMLNKRIAVCILKQAGVTGLSRKAHALSQTEIRAIAVALKGWDFPVTGLCGWKNAQVASGGVRLEEFDHRLMSKKVTGLFACGEVFDCVGDCGGYNLHWAWCTGLIAGMNASAVNIGDKPSSK